MSAKLTAALRRSKQGAMPEDTGMASKTPQRAIARPCKGVPGDQAKAVAKRLARNARPGSGSGTLDTTSILGGAAAVEFARQNIFNPLRNMTPQRIVQWIEEAKMGYLQAPLRAWEEMAARDDVIPTVKFKREDAVAQRSWSVMQTSAVEDDPTLQDAADDQRARLRYFWNNIKVVNAWDRTQRGGFAKFVREGLHVQTLRYGAIHIIWRITPKGLTATLEFLPGWMFEMLSGDLRYIGPQPGVIYGTPLDPQNWVTLGGRGLMEPGSLGYGMKHLGLNTWAKYCSKYGLGFVMGTTSAAINSPEWKMMERAVKGLSNDSAAVVGTGADIKILTAGGTGDTPSSLLVERIDKAFSAMWRGGDLATISSSSGQGTGANQQARESLLIEASDCTWLSEIMQEIDAKVIAYHDGEDAEVLSFSQIKGPDLADANLQLQVTKAAVAMGVRISKKTFCSDFNITAADEDDEDILAAPVKAAPSAAPGAATPLPSDRVKIVKPGQDDPALNANPWHDGKGRFSSRPGGGGASSSAAHDTPEMAEVRKTTQGTPQWLKAPNGDATRLSEADWLKVRTPAFKAKHGDWQGLYQQQRFDDLVTHAFDQKHKSATLDWRPFDAEEIAGVKQLTGVDATGFHHAITTDQIRHAAKQHPDLLPDDLKHLPEVLDGWDYLEKGTPSKGFESVRYVKQMPGRQLFYVERLFPTSRDRAPRGELYTAWKEVGPSTRPASGSLQRQRYARSAGTAREEHALTFGRINPQDVSVSIGADGEPLLPQGGVINSASADSAITPEIRAALIADLAPMKAPLAAALQDPGKIPALDLTPIRAVLENDNLTQELAGEFLLGFLIDCGASQAAAEAIIAEAIATEPQENP